MKRIGTVVRTAQGLAVLRADATDGDADDAHRDEIGTIVLDDSLDEVGRVVDVFGPVDQPYLAVTPDSGVHLPALVGSTLYAR
ncbi:tRNA/rRNA pseudouridine synthase complex protein Gar1 [Natrialba magadii ATCC 43099]|uniref:H/ACA RNA-protein complex component Gar1 n=1 Tax=Natrialba magadii (strain ATCC 43099 / DSM 3394 / CCM 3739 / CIP 104546 / IAM 13178 / JCM 8861 / NBRC 102185 / NCIMB 2190 / MS3) TaxID=547559 RepID=D3SU64_NATMM|nr:Gar1/Naf1 family protein [Natrialba magadii]ADD07153.1 tRNA/rRNA pseudouridine synthase complex protein Gar1 [Natrialba magadii ATCC 43099]ELY29071.1 H/ACA RNA-protein complex component Gar1 [Natrialba magadii ATCC 43099]